MDGDDAPDDPVRVPAPANSSRRAGAGSAFTLQAVLSGYPAHPAIAVRAAGAGYEMAITRPKPATVENFVQGAPDGQPARFTRGHKAQITLTIDPKLLDRMDAAAGTMGQSRAALINRFIFEGLERVER